MKNVSVSAISIETIGDTGVLTRDEIVYLCRTYGGNGDVFSHEEAKQLIEELGVDELGGNIDHKALTDALVPYY